MKNSKIMNIYVLIFMISFSLLSSIASKKLLSKKIKVEDKEDDDLKSILKDDYAKFIKELGVNVKDPKFRSAIRSLSSNNKVNHEKINVPVSYPLPTQNEVDVEKSLKFPLTNFDSAKQFLFCKQPIKIAGLSIVTSANGKYVIDGHHRWSQVFSLNPNCVMASLDLADISDPINALKSVQLGIAAGKDLNGNEMTKIPVAKVEGINLLKISEKDLKDYVDKLIAPDVLRLFRIFNSEIKTKADVADYIWKNVKQMQTNNQPVSGAPGRGIMPQTNMSSSWLENIVKIE